MNNVKYALLITGIFFILTMVALASDTQVCDQIYTSNIAFCLAKGEYSFAECELEADELDAACLCEVYGINCPGT